MLRQFTKVSSDTSVVEAAKKMISTKTRLLVYEGSEMVGIITTSDLTIALFATAEGNLSLEKVMSRTVFSMESYASVREAIRIVDNERLGSVYGAPRAR